MVAQTTRDQLTAELGTSRGETTAAEVISIHSHACPSVAPPPVYHHTSRGGAAPQGSLAALQAEYEALKAKMDAVKASLSIEEAELATQHSDNQAQLSEAQAQLDQAERDKILSNLAAQQAHTTAERLEVVMEAKDVEIEALKEKLRVVQTAKDALERQASDAYAAMQADLGTQLDASRAEVRQANEDKLGLVGQVAPPLASVIDGCHAL